MPHGPFPHPPHRTVHATLTAHGSPGVSLPHGGLLYRLSHQVPAPRLPLYGFARDSPHCCGSCVRLNVNSLAPFPLWWAFPTSEDYGATAAPDPGVWPLRAVATSPALPSLRELPMFPVLDSSDVRPVAVPDHPFRFLRLPTALQGNPGAPAAAFSPSVERGYGFFSACGGCPLRQGRTGDNFPVG